MAGPRDTAFDLGIKQLLCGDNEDDENFWAYFSEFVDAETTTVDAPDTTNAYARGHHVTNTNDMDFSRDEHD